MEQNWEIYYSPDAQKDLRKLPSMDRAIKENFLKSKEKLEANPYPIGCKKLRGSLKGKFSLRINDQHRLVYEIFPEEKIIKVVSILNHYSD